MPVLVVWTSDPRNGHAMQELDFDAFYDFAFPRVYRFAVKRCDARCRGESVDAAEAKHLCRLILERAFKVWERKDADGGDGLGSDRASLDSHRIGFWLFSIAKQTADEYEATLTERAPDSARLTTAS